MRILKACLMALMASFISLPVFATANYVGSETCVSCHENESTEWETSHHYAAMAEATEKTVLGEFNDTTFEHYGLVSRFYRKDGGYYVETDNAKGELQEFKIGYVFGVYPLQQYLIGFPDGRYQTLSITWDSRPAEEGGQRWYHMYPDEAIPADDILHWTGAMQNWNSRCAGCHSTNLRKNYDQESNSYKTSWSEINVACEACHGPASEHLAWAKAPETNNVAHHGFISTLDDKGVWDRAEGEPTAHRTGEARPQGQIETCAHCHSRRSELNEVPVNQSFLDSHQSQFLADPLYYPDGQIRDEVYVYDSFAQSKMHAQGVVCSNCHNPHSGKLKLEGNGLCLQCHNPQVFDTPDHHKHTKGSTGADCASCHMPETTYMGVDPRRDHSIRIPRPDVSEILGVPNACNQCHTDQSVAWAAGKAKAWYGDKLTKHRNNGVIFAAARANDARAVPSLAHIANDPSQSLVVRATALVELGNFPEQLSYQTAMAALQSESPQLRIAALRSLDAFLPAERRQILLPLYSDPVKAVRLELAPIIATMPASQLPEQLMPYIRELFDEYIEAQRVNADMPGAQLNLGIFYSAIGETEKAEKAYRHALKLAPKFVPALINMADYYRSIQQDWNAEALLLKAVRIAPDQSPARFSLGLMYVRQQQLDKALVQLAEAARLSPEAVRYSYVYGVGLDSAGRTDEALVVLESTLKRHPGNPEVLGALVHYYEKQGNAEKAAVHKAEMDRLYPSS
ncbi:MAG: tetratricopeptide repeat protein [Pseudomonadales bacterium]